MLDRVKCSPTVSIKARQVLTPYCPYVRRYHSELSAEQFPWSETYRNRIELKEELHDFHSGRDIAEVQPFPQP